MPQKRKDYVRFAVGQYAKEKKIRQQELAKEKASLSSEVKTLQRQIQRLDNKVFKFRRYVSAYNFNIRLQRGLEGGLISFSCLPILSYSLHMCR